jgi:hypothetical protein
MPRHIMYMILLNIIMRFSSYLNIIDGIIINAHFYIYPLIFIDYFPTYASFT